jgi:hypothetical protein
MTGDSASTAPTRCACVLAAGSTACTTTTPGTSRGQRAAEPWEVAGRSRTGGRSGTGDPLAEHEGEIVREPVTVPRSVVGAALERYAWIIRSWSIGAIILVSCPLNDLFEAVEAEEEDCLEPTDEQRQDAVDLAAAFEPMRSAADAWWKMHGERNVARRSLLEPLHLGPELDLPEDLPMTFVGEGTYELEAEWGRATLRLREPSNTVALLPHDIFDPESYLVGSASATRRLGPSCSCSTRRLRLRPPFSSR